MNIYKVVGPARKEELSKSIKPDFLTFNPVSLGITSILEDSAFMSTAHSSVHCMQCDGKSVYEGQSALYGWVHVVHQTLMREFTSHDRLLINCLI